MEQQQQYESQDDQQPVNEEAATFTDNQQATDFNPQIEYESDPAATHDPSDHEQQQQRYNQQHHQQIAYDQQYHHQPQHPHHLPPPHPDQYHMHPHPNFMPPHFHPMAYVQPHNPYQQQPYHMPYPPHAHPQFYGADPHQVYSVYGGPIPSYHPGMVGPPGGPWSVASSFQQHSSHAAAMQLRQANALRNRRKRHKAFDPVSILQATRIIEINGQDMSRASMITQQPQETTNEQSSSSLQPFADGESEPTNVDASVPQNWEATEDEEKQCSEQQPPPSDEVDPALNPVPTALQSPLPSTTYPTLHEIGHRPEYADCIDFRLQHGAYLPELHVRYVGDITACEVMPDGSPGPTLATRALEWLIESMDDDLVDDDLPVLGVDAEGRQIHVLQLSTRNRCVLLKFPHHVWNESNKNSHSNQSNKNNTSQQPSAILANNRSNNSSPIMQSQSNSNNANQPSAAATAAAITPPSTSMSTHFATAMPSETTPSSSHQSSSAPRIRLPGDAPSFPVPPLLKSLLEDHKVIKSGAEVWGDALDIFRDLGIVMNQSMNMTKSFFKQVLSLEAMTNLALVPQEQLNQGAWAFKKDRHSTISNWNADSLTLRQLAYAALDAQTSYFVGRNLARPAPFHLDRLPLPWLQQAGSWLLMSKYMELSQEKELRASFEDISFNENGLSLMMNRYNSRIRLGSDVTVHLTDGTRVACLVTAVSGKRADLAWENCEDVLGKDDVDIERITLTRKFEDTLLPKPVKDYLQSVVHNETENHPIVAALLSFFYDGPDVANPELVAHELNVSSSTLRSNKNHPNSSGNNINSTTSSSVQLPDDLMEQPWISELNDSQQHAVSLALSNFVTTIQGPPGSGKCWAPGTLLMRFDGTSVPVEEVRAGDLLMGDDSTPRVVQLDSVIKGCGPMYRIEHAARIGSSMNHDQKPKPATWEVNGDHILVLKCISQPRIHRVNSSSYVITRLQMAPAHPTPIECIDPAFSGPFGTEQQARATLDALLSSSAVVVQTFVFECTVSDYLNMARDVQQQVYMFQPDLVDFPCSSSSGHSLQSRIVQQGLPCNSTCEITRLIAASIINQQCSTSSPQVDAILSSYELSTDPATLSSLPAALLVDTVEVRLALLAGIIDTIGELVSHDKNQYAFLITLDALSGNHTLFNQIIHLARSLGVHTVTESSTSVRLSGLQLEHVAALMVVQQVPSGFQPLCTPFDGCESFSITPIGEGAFHGFTLDGNGRLLLGSASSSSASASYGFLVTHNTSTIAAIVRTLVCDPGCKILCVARTNTAARHMASACAKFLGPHKLTLQVSQEFFCEWHEDQYTELLREGYVPAMDKSGNAYDLASSQVLVMTTGICFTKPELTAGRTIVILDEASQIWDLEAILFLRAMPLLEKLILLGDSQQLSCYVAPEWRVGANSILDLANLAATRARVFQDHWNRSNLLVVKQCMLTIQYRMVAHLGNMISNLFYDGVLRSADTSTVRAVSWHDVRGFSQADDQCSVYNLAEIDEVIRLWRHLCSHGYRADEIVIISMYEAQRQKLQECGVISNARIYNCDSFQGQESPIVILVLANNVITDFLRDSRRINVACSRAQQRLYIVGDLSVFAAPEAGIWSKIAAYAASEYKPQMEMPDLESDFPSLAPSTTTGTAAAGGASNNTNTAVLTSPWSNNKYSIKNAIKPNPNRQAIPGSNPMQSNGTLNPIYKSAADIVRNSAASISAPSTPQQISQQSFASRLMGASPAATPTTMTAATASATTSNAPAPTSKLQVRATPFVPSKSAVEFVPGGVFKSAAPAQPQQQQQSSNPIPHENSFSATQLAPPTTSPSFSSVAAAGGSTPARAAANRTSYAHVTPTSSSAAANTVASEFASLPPSAVQAGGGANGKAPANLSFAARVAAAAAANATPSSAPAKSATPEPSFANMAAKIQQQQATAAIATPNKVPNTASATPPVSVASPAPATMASRLAAASAAAKPAQQSAWPALGSFNSKPAVKSGWICAACSFHNVLAERYCEVCESARM